MFAFLYMMCVYDPLEFGGRRRGGTMRDLLQGHLFLAQKVKQ
jgi:hypothetical protein